MPCGAVQIFAWGKARKGDSPLREQPNRAVGSFEQHAGSGPDFG